MIQDSDWTQVCEQATWALVFRKLDHDVYAVESAGEVSLVTQQVLIDYMKQLFRGGTHEVGGGPVG